jgi:hypothetical protein
MRRIFAQIFSPERLPVAGAEAYGKDVPSAEIHILDAGHFALDQEARQIARLTEDFLDRQKS